MTDQEREIGRVIKYIRSCREAGIDTTITIDKSRNHFILNALEEVLQYRSIGTVEECREAVERQRKKKPIKYDNCGNKCVSHRCPNCFEIVSGKYCKHCGQAISREESEEKDD